MCIGDALGSLSASVMRGGGGGMLSGSLSGDARRSPPPYPAEAPVRTSAGG